MSGWLPKIAQTGKLILIPAAQISKTIETLRAALNPDQILQSRSIALLPISFIGRCSVP